MLPQPLQQVRPPDRLSVRLVRYHARRTHRPDHAQRERQKTRDGGSDQLQQSSEDHSSVSSPKSLRTCLNAEATIDRLSMFLSIRFVRSSARLAASGSTSPGRVSQTSIEPPNGRPMLEYQRLSCPVTEIVPRRRFGSSVSGGISGVSSSSCHAITHLRYPQFLTLFQ